MGCPLSLEEETVQREPLANFTRTATSKERPNIVNLANLIWVNWDQWWSMKRSKLLATEQRDTNWVTKKKEIIFELDKKKRQWGVRVKLVSKKNKCSIFVIRRLTRIFRQNRTTSSNFQPTYWFFARNSVYVLIQFYESPRILGLLFSSTIIAPVGFECVRSFDLCLLSFLSFPFFCLYFFLFFFFLPSFSKRVLFIIYISINKGINN